VGCRTRIRRGGTIRADLWIPQPRKEERFS
jgi:hypothetical protein